MDLAQLKYFLAVVETGSFTRAAQQCYVTQPSLSAGVKKLETLVGRDLFVRSNRRVFLTDAGSRFLPKARAIVHEYNQALEAVAEAESRILRLGVLSTIADQRLQYLVQDVRAALPDVAIEITDGSEQELLNRLEDRSIDYALTIDRADGRYEHFPLAEEAYRFIMAKNHPLASADELHMASLANEHMIVRSRCEMLSETSRQFTDHNIRPRLVFRTGNDARAVSMVAAGLGCTLVPAGWLDERLASPDLKGFHPKRKLALLRAPTSAAPVLESLGAQLEQIVISHAQAHW